MAREDYDGFYFLPGDDDEELNLSYFKFKEEAFKGKPVGSSTVGDMYHVAFFSRDDLGNPKFDDTFEAIFADPSVYIKGLVGSNVYGCILRKTEKSQEWFDEYLERALTKLHAVRLIDNLKAIANSK